MKSPYFRQHYAAEAPCLNCPDRAPGCHNENTCEKWKSFRSQIDEDNARREERWSKNPHLARRRSYWTYANKLHKAP